MAPGGPVGGSEVRRAGRLVAEFIKLKAVPPPGGFPLRGKTVRVSGVLECQTMESIVETNALDILEIEKMYIMVYLKDNHVTVLDKKSYC